MLDGPELKRYRKALKVTQKELAELIGISQSFISLVEAGKYLLTKKAEQKIKTYMEKQTKRKKKKRDYKRLLTSFERAR